ncbi:MAG: hypothetical protein AAF492_28995, partial [Verrucomicrobiota bacterium]
EAEQEAREQRTRLAALEAEATTLRDSPEMRNKRELDEALHRATECEKAEQAAREDGEAAQQQYDASAADHQQIHTRHQEHRRNVVQSYASLAEAAGSAEAPEEIRFDWPTADPATEQARVNGFLNNRRKAMAHLRQRNRDIERERIQFDQARKTVEQRHAEADAAAEKVDKAEQQLEQESISWNEAVIAWENDLEALHEEALPRGRDWLPGLTEWLEERTGPAPPFRELGPARERVRDEIAARRSVLETRDQQLDLEIERIDEERSALEAGIQLEPAPPPLRASRPADRPGAPFWRLCEFRLDIPEEEHAGWEAALQASGLLDAWVFPDGSLGPAMEDDDFLLLNHDHELDEANSLAAILEPAEAGDTVAALLRRIGNHRGAGPCWVA